MSDTTKTPTPRITTISATPSSSPIPGNDGVQIDREVVVTSHKQPFKRSTSTPQMTQNNNHERARSHDILSSTAAPRSRSFQRVLGAPTDRYSSADLDHFNSAYPDPGRESMNALADFLMTNKPPPNNWISVPSDDEMSLKTVKKYKLFGIEHKKKRRVHKQQKSIQLPPTAVSARTRSGNRHIAISIPWEHDYQEFLKPAQPISRPHTAPRLYTSERGAVTVLKPVVEARESISSLPVQDAGEAGGRPRANTPPSIVLGPEATRTLEKYYQQMHRHHQKGKAETKPESPEKRAHIATALDSTKVDQRYSAGTIYSASTYSTALGHSRGASSTSTAPDVGHFAGARIDNFPPRKSSKGKQTANEERSTANGSRKDALETPLEEPHNHPLKSLTGSFNSGSSSSHSHPTVLLVATADLARGYRSPGPQYLSRTTTPITSEPPSKRLPDLPMGASLQRPGSAPLSRNNSGTTIPRRRESPVRRANSNTNSPFKRDSPVKRANSGASKGDSPVKPTRSGGDTFVTGDSPRRANSVSQQARLDRVKARKMRDLAAARINTPDGYFSPILEPEYLPESPDIAALIPPPQISHGLGLVRTHRYDHSLDLAYKKSLNTISPIMIVVDLPPYTGLVLPSDLPTPGFQHYQKHSNNTSAHTITSVMHTPPRSSHGDSGQSDSDTIPNRSQSTSRNCVSREKGAASALSSKRSSTASIALETRRQQRRSKRNMTLHERDLDQRVEKLERDNALLVSTLKVIANSFGVLNRMFPEDSDVLAAGGIARTSGHQGEGKEGDAGVEVLIRDLQKRSNRVSGGVYDNTRVEPLGRVRLEESE